MTTRISEIAAEMKKPRLMAVMPLRSLLRGTTTKMPAMAVITPMPGTMRGNTSPDDPNALTPRISEATSMTA